MLGQTEDVEQRKHYAQNDIRPPVSQILQGASKNADKVAVTQ